METSLAHVFRIHACLCTVGRFDDSVIEERRQCSEDLLQFSANIPALYNSQHIQEFFKVPEHTLAEAQQYQHQEYALEYFLCSRVVRSMTAPSSLDQRSPFPSSWLTVYQTVALMVGLHRICLSF